MTKLEQKHELKKRGRPRKNPQTAPAPAHPVKREAPQANYFVLCNGKPVKNIKELADVMEDLEDHVFNHHVRPEHNDFASWVHDIFNDVELAEKIAETKDKKHMQLVVYKHIAHKLW